MTTDAFQRSITGLLRQVPEVRLNNQGGFGAAGWKWCWPGAMAMLWRALRRHSCAKCGA
jgi:hypothetical protein